MQTRGEGAFCHFAPCENMEVEVKHGLPSPCPIIDHQSKSVAHTQLFRNLTGHQ